MIKIPFSFPNPAERKRRLAVCQACPDLLKTKIPFSAWVLERCGVCGCPVVSRSVVGCPVGKF